MSINGSGGEVDISNPIDLIDDESVFSRMSELRQMLLVPSDKLLTIKWEHASGNTMVLAIDGEDCVYISVEPLIVKRRGLLARLLEWVCKGMQRVQ